MSLSHRLTEVIDEFNSCLKHARVGMSDRFQSQGSQQFGEFHWERGDDHRRLSVYDGLSTEKFSGTAVGPETYMSGMNARSRDCLTNR